MEKPKNYDTSTAFRRSAYINYHGRGLWQTISCQLYCVARVDKNVLHVLLGELDRAECCTMC